MHEVAGVARVDEWVPATSAGMTSVGGATLLAQSSPSNEGGAP